jgi:hypothetical protein
MTEQISKLALQCGAWHQVYGNRNFMIDEHFDINKFAQLIVRECINKIETHQIPVGNSAAGEMACEWTYDALKEIRDEIQEHFGVEE